MRTIDADVLKELFSEVIGHIAQKPEMNGNLEHMIRASAMVIQMIDDAPTVNALNCSEIPNNSDAISRQAAIDEIHGDADWLASQGSDWQVERMERDKSILKSLPSVQPEIIRCKDCKYCEHWYADKGRCFLWHEGGIDVFEEGFCNYAERREDG